MKEEDSILYQFRKEKRQRLLNVVAVGLAAAGFLSFLYLQFYSKFERTDPRLMAYTIMPISLSIAIFLFIYLQRGFTISKKSNNPEVDLYDAERNMKRVLSKVQESYESRVHSLEKQLQKKVSQLELSAGSREELIAQLKTSLQTDAAEEIIRELKEKIESESEAKALDGRYSELSSRLRDEVSSLGRRGNLNLILGIFTSIIGLSILGFTVFNGHELPQEPKAALIFYFPRISLILLIEIFGYFFLKLYKGSLSEIKYFQNELTNIESRYIAVTLAHQLGNNDLVSEVISNLSKTERNFVLSKGESTVELEKDRMTLEQENLIVNRVSSLLKQGKNG